VTKESSPPDRKAVFSDIRQVIQQSLQKRSIVKAGFVLCSSMLIYLVAASLFLFSPWWLMPLTSLLLGVAGNVLFVIAHDSAHNSFTPKGWLNAIVARCCFLPAWHSYTGWVHAHNHVHHGWTNLRTKDYVWAPISKSEYDQLSRWNQWRVRFHRSVLGFALYYLVEINFKKIWMLQPEVRNARVRRMWMLDNTLLVAAILGQAWLWIWLAQAVSNEVAPLWLLFFAMVVPGVFTNFLVGFTTYLQHTHPAIPWFDNKGEWTFYIGQVRGTTHTHLPYKINSLFHNVMDHTAHHVDPRVPLYHLPEAQQKIEKSHLRHIVQHRFTLHSLSRTLKVCQLYDYANHCWLDFDGNQTSSRTINFESLEGTVSQPI
jgi:acyl-lipid omega-6 desaturase (Delta-12 desaturase)